MDSSSRTANSALRVRDTDRVDACAVLDAAREDGQLSEAEHAERTRSAMRARTFGDLDAVVDDLQIPANLVDTPMASPARRAPSRRWLMAGAVVVATALIGMLCGWVTSDDGPLGREMPDMTTQAGIEAFFSAYREHFGDLLADQVTLHPDSASISRPGAGDRSKSERFSYDGEFDRSVTTGREPDLEPVDLAEVDLPKLAALLAGTPQTVGSPQAPISHLMFERSTGGYTKEPVVTIYAEGARAGYLTIGFTGEPLHVSKAGG